MLSPRNTGANKMRSDQISALVIQNRPSNVNETFGSWKQE